MPDVLIFKDFKKRTNSTKRPNDSLGVTVHVDFKGSCSLINPTFLITNFDNTYNYMKWGNRYYFMTSVVYQNRNVVEVSYKIDALASWRGDILASTQYVLRSASASDGSIADNMYITKLGNYQTRDYISNEQIFYQPPTANPSTQYHYVLATIGGNSTASLKSPIKGINYYLLTPNQLNDFINYVSESAEEYLNVSSAVLDGNLLKALYNPFQYIVSCKYIPIDLGNVSGHTHPQIDFGYWRSTAVGYPMQTPIKEIETSLIIGKHPQASTRGIYLNMTPYSRYTLFINPFGEFPLNNADLIDENVLKIHIWCDLTTGEAQLTVKASDYEHQTESIHSNYFKAKPTILTASAMLAIDVPLTSMTTDYVGAISSMNNYVSSTSGALMRGDVGGAISNAVNGLGDIAQSVQPQLQKSGTVGSFINALNQDNIRIKEEYIRIVDEDNEDLGRPLCQKKVLSTLSGFCMVRDADIDLTATAEEIDTIKNYMMQGFFIE